jgi:hypothetical protein
MNYITSFIGKPPDYWITCVNQIRLFSDDPIWCITNHIKHSVIKKIQKIQNVHCIDYSTVINNKFLETIHSNKNKFWIVRGLRGREQLFIRALERFFLCENLMKQKNLKDVLFLELDNMIYMNPIKFLNSLQKKPLAYMYDNEDRSSAGIMYIRDPSSLEKFNQESILFIEKSDEFLDEMTVLARFALQYPDDVQYLPVHIPVSEYPVCTYENLEDYSCIFDAAPLGVYLFGRDPYHTKGVIVKGLHNPFSLIDFTKYKFEWKLDEKGRKCPWISFSETESYPIFNLHIHSKTLEEAHSVKENLKTPGSLRKVMSRIFRTFS